MSFATYKSMIEEGDTVILYIDFNQMYPLRVTARTQSKKSGESIEHVKQTPFGALKVKDLVGKKFGTRVALSRGYAYALYPTPELWTKTLPHRTQILYATDIALITLQLELRPGSVVAESGTGSGSLTHSLARSVAPSGKVHTFDFHQQRSEQAKKEFEEHCIDHLVSTHHRDVCSNGFGLDSEVDAVFLDLPKPWEAVPHAKNALKSSGGRLCSFSPCVEQVQRLCKTLKEEGFDEPYTIECLLREFQVKRVTLPVFDSDRQSKEEERTRKRRLDDENGTEEPRVKEKDPETSFVTGVPLFQMPGHTGYLTFASLPAKR